ncbi:hypothetical protein ACIBQX_50560 [Nonomuraea sp. NPDC049714]|uniref:hypothetical protein n=1 Tax=Nonomuraea sp. NPDC049714 TaxID=3364357 RepID=UPI0037A80F04
MASLYCQDRARGDVGVWEVLAFEEQGLVEVSGKGVGEAAAHVEFGLGIVALAVGLVRPAAILA